MKEYEVAAKFCNACAGSSRPQTFFEEAELENQLRLVYAQIINGISCVRTLK